MDIVVVDAQANASVTHLGLRRRMLTLGLPLWEVLTPQQRIALLGHELGHFTHGDTRHGMVVGTAYRSLTTWHYYLSPIQQPTLVEALVNLLYVVPRALIGGLVLLLDLLTSSSARRSEYLADAAAARAGSTEAAVGLMDRLHVTESVETTPRMPGRRRLISSIVSRRFPTSARSPVEGQGHRPSRDEPSPADRRWYR